MPRALIHFILVRFNACLSAIVNERHCLSPAPVQTLSLSVNDTGLRIYLGPFDDRGITNTYMFYLALTIFFNHFIFFKLTGGLSSFEFAPRCNARLISRIFLLCDNLKALVSRSIFDFSLFLLSVRRKSTVGLVIVTIKIRTYMV